MTNKSLQPGDRDYVERTLKQVHHLLEAALRHDTEGRRGMMQDDLARATLKLTEVQLEIIDATKVDEMVASLSVRGND